MEIWRFRSDSAKMSWTESSTFCCCVSKIGILNCWSTWILEKYPIIVHTLPGLEIFLLSCLRHSGLIIRTRGHFGQENQERRSSPNQLQDTPFRWVEYLYTRKYSTLCHAHVRLKNDVLHANCDHPDGHRFGEKMLRTTTCAFQSLRANLRPGPNTKNVKNQSSLSVLCARERHKKTRLSGLKAPQKIIEGRACEEREKTWKATLTCIYGFGQPYLCLDHKNRYEVCLQLRAPQKSVSTAKKKAWAGYLGEN